MPFEDLAGDGQADQGRDLSTIFARPLQEGGCPCGRPRTADSFRKGKAKFVFKHDVAPSRRDFFFILGQSWLSQARMSSSSPLDGSGLPVLAAPAQIVQQAADVIRMISQLQTLAR